jgi:hypothetical protein
MTNRPKIKVKLQRADYFIEALGWIVLVCLWTFTLLAYFESKGTEPLQLRETGHAHHPGTGASLFILPCTGTLIFLGMGVLNRYPHLFNYPVAITVKNAVGQYALAVRLIRVLKLLTVSIFCYTAVQKYLNIIRNVLKPDWWIVIAIVIAFASLSLAYIIKSIKMAGYSRA